MLKLQKFLLSNKNMVGLGFASIVIVLAIIGILKAFWLPITVMTYIFGYLVGPEEKKIKFYHIRGENLNDYVGFIEKLKNNIGQSTKLPVEAQNMIIIINTNAIELLVFLQGKENFDEHSEEFTNFKSIFDSYLPKLINQYEKLPVKYATQVKTSNGKTAKEMLLEQLKLLEQKVTEISYGMYENDVTALKVNGRFLKEKFANQSFFEEEREHNA